MEEGGPELYCRLNVDLGHWFADAALAAIAESGVARSDVRAIASHGQTIWHIPATATWQLGESAVIAERTGIDVVSDFRVRDVAAGGHGAPLVSIADALLYADADRWRLLQNIGGMANVTVVPPGTLLDDDLHGVRAFDTGPGVAVIDAVVRLLYPDSVYDRDGLIASQGLADDVLVAECLQDPYFTSAPPKSTGREQFGVAYAQRLITGAQAHGRSFADTVATAVALTARVIADAYDRFIPEPADDVVLSGGGAKNPALVRALHQTLAPRSIRTFDELYYDGEAKEAVAFAFLAYLHLHRRTGNVIGATGARGPRILGKLTPA
jgi:anhydro-N-acetylmuramic acid kinase